jgi:hypothetical protein
MFAMKEWKSLVNPSSPLQPTSQRMTQLAMWTLVRDVHQIASTVDPFPEVRYSGLNANSKTSLHTATIDSLYSQIFEAAYAGKEPNEVITMRLALDTIICSREPLSFSAIAVLVGSTPKDLSTVLGHFRSVINVPSSSDAPVAPFHESFADYVRSSTRAGIYAMDPAFHATMARMCFQCLNTLLRQNMCGITGAASMSKISVTVALPDVLKYVCLHWVAHLVLLTPSDAATIADALETFARAHLLHWLECLTLMDQLNAAVELLNRAIDFFMVCIGLLRIIPVSNNILPGPPAF